MTHFDPDAPGRVGRLFGLDCRLEEATVTVIPVPFDATASGRRGAMAAAEGIRYASAQVDLYDLDFGDVWRSGIALEPVDARIHAWNIAAREAVDGLRMDGTSNAAGLRRTIDACGDAVETLVSERVRLALEAGRIPAVVGGDHSVALGAIRAAACRHPGLGVLQFDAHADLRPAFEGLKHSHASVMNNVMRGPDRPAILVQVGVRDVGPGEWRTITTSPDVVTWTDPALRDRVGEGQSWSSLVDAILEPLPCSVWISFDIDGLDPALCPSTGTPVPGGLSWNQATSMIVALARSGRHIVGFDLCEVGPDEWDANVGARLLYKLSAAAIATREYGVNR